MNPVNTTGITPAELLFGNAVSLNDRILPHKEEEVGIEARQLSEVTAEMLAHQAHLTATALKLFKAHDAKLLATPFDTRKTVDHFPVGSYVFVEYDSTLKGRGAPHKRSRLSADPTE